MIDDELKAVALALICVVAVGTVYPILASRRIVEPYSEIGVLGSRGKIGDYPRQLAVGQRFNLTIYVGNYEGRAEYYRVMAKVGDEQSTITDIVPMNVPPFSYWDFILMNGQNSSLPVTLAINEAGLNRRLVFELHIFDSDSSDFVYHQRWIQLWMNVTETT